MGFTRASTIKTSNVARSPAVSIKRCMSPTTSRRSTEPSMQQLLSTPYRSRSSTFRVGRKVVSKTADTMFELPWNMSKLSAIDELSAHCTEGFELMKERIAKAPIGEAVPVMTPSGAITLKQPNIIDSLG